MAREREKVVVAMSGGVDSSVAACLLVEQGYDVMGLFMRVGAEEPVGATGGLPASAGEPGGMPGHAGGAGRRDETEAGEAFGTSRGLKPAAREDAGNVVGSAHPASRMHQGCCSASDAADARFVAGMLGIPFYALNFREDFDQIIDDFADEYVSGRTPNPCIVCNDKLKFGKLVDYADAVGAKYVATGHYARIADYGCCRPDRLESRSHRPALESHSVPDLSRKVLLRGRDPGKDQSYVLFGVDRAVLDRVMFPVGELTKSEVRAAAARFGLPNRDKPDSVEICFVPDRDYARIVRQRRPGAFVEGDVLDQDGHVIGRHKGIGNYTIGQRRGLGIAAGKPIYVTRLDPNANTVTMGDGDALLCSTLLADRTNFLVDPPDGPFRAQVKIRYLHSAAPATVEVVPHAASGGSPRGLKPAAQGSNRGGANESEGRRVRVVFDEPQRAITPGQAVVFYDGEVVLGGAWIERNSSASVSDARLAEVRG